ncbi:MAG TPA: AAA family ATPase [Acidothermaceae bacterium]|jgi:dephospho-CoA kinase
MARVLVTGMSGTGKTTVLDELRRRGHLTLDTDYDGWVIGDKWDEPRMNAFLRDHGDVFVAGTVENQGSFYDRFDHVVLLSAPLHVLLARVTSRTNNPYGKTAQQRAAIASYIETVEPILRRGASLELDAQRPASALADSIEDLVSCTH